MIKNSRNMQRGKTSEIDLVNFNIRLAQQKRYNIFMALKTSYRQWRIAIFVFNCIYIGVFFYQQFNNFKVTVLASEI